MPDQHQPDPDPTPDPQAAHASEPGEPGTGGTPNPADAGNREAAKWHRKLREEEAKTAALTGRIETFEKAAVEARAAEVLRDPSDLWAVTSLDDLRGDDGAVEEGKLSAVLQRIEAEKPHWLAPRADMHQGATRGETEREEPSFGELLRRANRGG